MYISFQRGGRSVKVRAEEFVWDLERKRPMEGGAWVFSGSTVDRAGFSADRDGVLIATYRDPAAVINHRLPGGSDDALYKANPRVVPAVGTPVTLTVTPSAFAGGS
jgi:hypothetical protein